MAQNDSVLFLSAGSNFGTRTLRLNLHDSNWSDESASRELRAIAADGDEFIAIGDSVVGTRSWIYRWKNDGHHWQEVNASNLPQSLEEIAAIGPVIVASSTDSGTYRSTDYGMTWSKSTSMRLNNLLAANGEFFGYNLYNIYRSKDMGVSWTSFGRFGHIPTSFTLIGDTVLVGTGQTNAEVMRLLPPDTVWHVANSGIPRFAEVTSFARAGSILFAGLGQNASTVPVMYSKDGGGSWSGCSTGLPTSTTIWHRSLSVFNGMLYAGINHTGPPWNGLWKRSLDNILGSPAVVQFSVSSGGFTVFPNPFSSDVTFTLPENPIGAILIVNALGVVLARLRTQSGERTYTWNGTNLGGGSFFALVRTQSGSLHTTLFHKN